MVDQRWVRVFRIVFGLLTFAAIGYQFREGSQRDVWNPVNFFSFFTIQSNIIAAVVLLAGAFPERERSSGTWTVVRGAATMYMVTTGIVYALLLSGLEESLQMTSPWVNAVLHQVMPVVMVIDLIVRAPRPSIRPSNALLWLVYPFAWLVYTLVRGPVVDWYPYPFIDPREEGGYPLVAAYCVAILLGFLALSWCAAWVTQRLSTNRLVAASSGAGAK